MYLDVVSWCPLSQTNSALILVHHFKRFNSKQTQLKIVFCTWITYIQWNFFYQVGKYFQVNPNYYL